MVAFLANPLYTAAAVILARSPPEIPRLCKGAEKS
jgi:hypothetical protein